MPGYFLSHLDRLEAESLHILRETAAEFERPVLLYSAGKDSSVLVHLARKAFAPAPMPFPLLHVDTGFKFPEMYAFRDRVAKSIGADLRIFRNEQAIAAGTNPQTLGTQRCCALLKTEALLQALKEYGHDAAIGGARRDEERSRAKERIFSFRNGAGQWDPRGQRPELWHLYNGRLNPGESMRVFPLSNWTERDIWHYIRRESIEVVSLYFAAGPSRYRTLGCGPCTGSIRSAAATLDAIVEEMDRVTVSERATRAIDHDTDASMEKKKREGYF